MRKCAGKMNFRGPVVRFLGRFLLSCSPVRKCCGSRHESSCPHPLTPPQLVAIVFAISPLSTFANSKLLGLCCRTDVRIVVFVYTRHETLRTHRILCPQTESYFEGIVRR